MARRVAWVGGALCLTLLALPSLGQAMADPAPSPKSYLNEAQHLALAAAVPSPPAPGSEQDWADRRASELYRQFENTERWLLATSHAELRPPMGMQHFDCTLGFRLGAVATPVLTEIMTRILHDSDGVAERVKARAARPRPIAVDADRPACQKLSGSGRGSSSYPSGSASVAAAYGEVLADLVPERADSLRHMAQLVALSRIICGMHYPRDVAVGLEVGRNVHALIATSPLYRADLLAAQAEIAAARQAGQTSPACAAERSALAMTLD